MIVLIDELSKLASQPAALSSESIALSLLRAIVEAGYSYKTDGPVLVPDTSHYLQLSTTIIYNDIPSSDVERSLSEVQYIASRSVDRELANKLHLRFMSSLGDEIFDDEDDDMQESLFTRIREVLRQYSIDQALSEMMANAVDAGAKSFNVTLDASIAPVPLPKYFSSAFEELDRLPTLIIHNDVPFLPRDFIGIKNIGVGGKLGVPDSIGQFGLGALSIYHFTDVSAGCVLYKALLKIKQDSNNCFRRFSHVSRSFQEEFRLSAKSDGEAPHSQNTRVRIAYLCFNFNTEVTTDNFHATCVESMAYWVFPVNKIILMACVS